MARFKNVLQQAPSWLFQLLILTAPALYNTYPLLSGDTSTYISAAMEWNVPIERPIFYSVFIRLMSLGWSLWGVILAQNIILLYLLRRTITYFELNISQTVFTGLLFALVLFTGIGWESNKLLADIFVAFLFLSAVLFLKLKKMSRLDQYALPFIFFFSCTTHYSHMVIGLIFMSILTLYRIRLKKPLKPALLMLGLSIASFLSVMGTNAIAGRGFKISGAGSVFVVGKMVESGIIKTYLDEHCADEYWSLCEYKDSLPVAGWQFVWEPNSPVNKTGGWKKNDEEYKRLIKATFSKPKYLLIHAYKAVENTAIQMFQLSSGDNLFRNEEDSNIKRTIAKYFPHEYPRSMWTRQFLLELKFRTFSDFYWVSFALGLMTLLFIWNKIENKEVMGKLLLITFLFCLINAFVTANLSNISSRLQARVFWIPFWFMLLMGYRHFAQKLDLKSQK
jgi:hypothetical protein